MDLRKIKKLIDLLEESNLAELEIKEGEEIVRLSRYPKNMAPTYTAPPSAGPAAVQVSAPAAASPAPSEPETTASSPSKDLPPGTTVCSPMVGTFYRAASPEAEPFVGAGDSVGENSTLCIIEAMKVMNEIKAEKSGTICEVVAEDGTAVQFGDPLFRIK